MKTNTQTDYCWRFTHAPLWALTGVLCVTAWAAQAAEPSLAYTVKSGDELIKMADASFTNSEGWKEVAQLNHLKNPNAIQPGQVLKIPLRLLKTRALGAQLVSSSGDVRVAGQVVPAGSMIAEGAELQTGANASAQLLLADHSRVTLMPNTQARLTTSQIIDFGGFDRTGRIDPNSFKGLISLGRGALDVLAAKLAKRTTPLQVETPTSVVGVRGTVFRVAYEDPAQQNARTEVLEGLVRADSLKQPTGADLPNGTGAVLNPGVQRVKVVPLLKAPSLSGGAVVSQLQPQWALPALAGAERFRVQVSGFADFSNIVLDQVVNKQGLAQFPTLPNGQWQVRVRGIDANTLEGFNANTTLQKVLPPSPTEPSRYWQPRNETLQVINGQPVLAFEAQGLDASHVVLASLQQGATPGLRVSKVLVKPVDGRISLPLGRVDLRETCLMNFTVTQADGATLNPVNYVLERLPEGQVKLSAWSEPSTVAPLKVSKKRKKSSKA